MDKIDLIYDLVNKIDAKVESMDDNLGRISIDVSDNKKDLQIHMARTDANEARIKANEDKLTMTYLIKVVTSAVIGSGAVAGAIWQIIRVING